MKRQERFFARHEAASGVKLNEVQREAVVRTEGPLLLLASPGSGKTTTMIMRIGYLIEERRVDPSRIKAVTFSRAAAADMKERFARLFPELVPVSFSTIHSLAFEITRDYYIRTGTPFRIIEGDVKEDEAGEALPLHKKIILRTLYHQVTGQQITDEQMDELTTYISYIKNKMVPPARWSEVKTDVPEADRVLEEYERFKRTGHDSLLLDFDDMLTAANDALGREPVLLNKYSRRYDYILADESQDTSLVQHELIAKLVRRHGNLCVVADDDQSIYSWRGAEPAYLLDFRSAYPEAAVLFMEQNYRSTPSIVNTANRFIKRNVNRYDKNMFTRNREDQPIVFRSLANYRFQAKYLAREIGGLDKPGEAAVLYRNNASSIALINEFDRAGIPFYMKDADNRFFSHWVIEDVLNFMRMTFTDKRPELLEKIHLKLTGYISRQQMAALMQIRNDESVFDNLLNHVELRDYQVKLLETARDTFRQMKGMPPLQAIRVIRGRLGYEKALEKMSERMGFRKEALIGILNTLEEIADGLETMEDFANRLKYLEALLKTAKRRKGEQAVTFSTFHSAKGLEFDRVYMIDLVDGIIPSSEDAKRETGGEGEAMEEAVRLFYVGMTRAKRRLELVVYKERDGESATESPFVTAVREIADPAAAEALREAAAAERAERRTAVPIGRRSSGGAGSPAGTTGRAGGESASRTGGGNARLGGTSAGASGFRTAISAPASRRGPAAVTVTSPAASAGAPRPGSIVRRDGLTPGLAVRHRAFGRGEIVGVEGDRIEVRFGGESKRLSVESCLKLGLLEPG